MDSGYSLTAPWSRQTPKGEGCIGLGESLPSGCIDEMVLAQREGFSSAMVFSTQPGWRGVCMLVSTLREKVSE